MRPLEIAGVVFLFLVSAGVGVAWARSPATSVSGGSPAVTGPSSPLGASPSPSPSPPPPCTTALIVTAFLHDHEVVGLPRPYVLPSPSDPAPEAALQFDLPQDYNPHGSAFVLVYATVNARVRAQFAFPESDNVGGSGRLIWSLDSVAPSYSAPYRLTLGAMTTGYQPCALPEG